LLSKTHDPFIPKVRRFLCGVANDCGNKDRAAAKEGLLQVDPVGH
jgi:hypothetical protein